MRKFGDILLDLEVILDEMIDDHDVQWGDILGLVYSHLMTHRPDAQEQYEDNTHPIYSYSPKED